MECKEILTYFADMKDPRIERTKRHLMDDILFISIAAVLSGAESWDEIEEYGNKKLPWLETLLSLPNCIPSHDTFSSLIFMLIRKCTTK